MKLYISVLNCIACLGVIFLHANSIFWGHPTGFLWTSANFIETFFYWPVPVFFMISGATLMNYRKRYSTIEFLKKRISKTVVPFLFWSIVAGLFMAKITKTPMDRDIIHIIDNIFNTRYFSIYWFFIPLFAIYLSLPLISRMAEYHTLLFYAIAVGSIFVFTIPLVCSLLHINMNSALIPPVVSGYIVYVLLGYMLNQVDLSKKARVIIYLIGVVGWFTHFMGATILSEGVQEINSTFKGYTNLPCLLHSTAVFVFFKYMDYKKILGSFYDGFKTVIFKCASCTFGIYLLHFFFILWIPYKYQIDCRKISWRIGGALVIFTSCLFFTYICKKIPIIKYLVP